MKFLIKLLNKYKKHKKNNQIFKLLGIQMPNKSVFNDKEKTLKLFSINCNDLAQCCIDSDKVFAEIVGDLSSRKETQIHNVYKRLAFDFRIRGRTDLYVFYLEKSLKLVKDLRTIDSLFHALVLAPDIRDSDFKNAALLSKIVCGETRKPHKMQNIREKQKINIGYTCCYFYHLGSRIHCLPLMKSHNRDRFNVFAFSDSDGVDESGVADKWICTKDLSDDEFSRVVKESQIDILVELNGRGDYNRFGSFRNRVAPIQVSFGNFPATSGADYVDCCIADKNAIEEKLDEFFSEKVYTFKKVGVDFELCWPDNFFPDVTDIPSAKNGYVTYGCFGGTLKINVPLIQKWIKLMEMDSTGLLYIKSSPMSDPDVLNAYYNLFEMYGMDMKRLKLEGGEGHKTMLEKYSLLDVALDTFPYSGGNTSLEALWQGVPVITLSGKRWASCITTGFYKTMELDRFTTTTWDEYLKRAISIGKNEKYRTEFRKQSRRIMKESELLNIKSYTSDIEESYEKMVLEFTH